MLLHYPPPRSATRTPPPSLPDSRRGPVLRLGTAEQIPARDKAAKAGNARAPPTTKSLALNETAYQEKMEHFRRLARRCGVKQKRPHPACRMVNQAVGSSGTQPLANRSASPTRRARGGRR